jgi:hypothetical protein
MNINGLVRSYLARNQTGEEFFKLVADLMERQLKEWDPEYEVFLMKFSYYELTVKKGDQYYHVLVTENELTELQKADPFALDKKLWNELEKQGLPIKKGYGNYLDIVL